MEKGPIKLFDVSLDDEKPHPVCFAQVSNYFDTDDPGAELPKGKAVISTQKSSSPEGSCDDDTTTLFIKEHQDRPHLKGILRTYRRLREAGFSVPEVTWGCEQGGKNFLVMTDLSENGTKPVWTFSCGSQEGKSRDTLIQMNPDIDFLEQYLRKLADCLTNAHFSIDFDHIALVGQRNQMKVYLIDIDANNYRPQEKLESLAHMNNNAVFLFIRAIKEVFAINQ